MKRFRRIAFMSLLIGMLSPLHSLASRDLTLLLIPREDGPVRVGMDVGNRYPTLLLSYKVLSNGAVSLHGWSGAEWVNITPESYETGTFFSTSPTTALVVVKEGRQVPATLVPSPAWCPAVYQISTTETRPLLHVIGRRYNFKYRDWKWFSENYNLPLDSINPDGVNVPWFHRRLDDNMKKRSMGSSDLQYLSVIRIPLPVSEAGPEQATEEEPAEDSGPTEEEPVETIEENPLTNAVPQAVVLGAGDADETEEPESNASTNTAVIPEEGE